MRGMLADSNVLFKRCWNARIGMPTDSNVWMKDVCILGSIARGLLADSNCCWKKLGY